jgi:hypothetical protein
MGLKKFHEYANSLDNKAPEKKVVKESKVGVNKKIVKQKEFNKKIVKPKKVNEASFLVGQDYKVKSTFDVSQQLVQQYIEKVTEETGKNPLDNFNEAEIAEQMIDFIVKQHMIIDNLPSDFTVGSEPTSDMENADDLAQADSEDLDADMGEEPDEEFDMESDSNIVPETETEDDNATGEIEFDLEESDIDEEIEVESDDMAEDETETEDETESEDGGFEEIEFDEKEDSSEEDTEDKKKPKTVGEYLNKKKESESESEEEEEEEVSQVEDLYKKVGYKTGYFESLNMNNLYKRL